MFKLRTDFVAADKVQMEWVKFLFLFLTCITITASLPLLISYYDICHLSATPLTHRDDITASIVAPTEKIPAAQSNQPCLKVCASSLEFPSLLLIVVCGSNRDRFP